MLPNTRSLLALPLVIGLALSACASEVDDSLEGEGDTGETEAAISTSSCKLSRATILASATGGRRTAIERAFTWLDAKVPYSQSRTRKDANGTYRTDCSGFVSMAWQLGTSYTTADFINGGGKSGPLGSYDKFLPGDALVRRSNGSGHIVLFLGWNDAAKSAACVLEQASTADDMQFRARSTASLKGSPYKAIRADKLVSSGGTAPTADDDDEPETPAGGTSTSPGSGKACTSTGQCNPGNNGAGLICVGGFCKPGCTSNVQCPGSKTCVGGQCK